MRKKSAILATLFAGAVLSASAQDEKKFACDSWKDNFFISIGAGVQGTTNPDSKLGETITPLVNVSLGKLITPVWGVRGQVYGWSSKMVTDYPFESVKGPKVERKENYIGFNLDGMMNLINLFGGYKSDRAFDLNLFAGPSLNVVKNYSGWKAGYSEVKTPIAGGTKVENVLDPSKSEPIGHDLRYLIGASVGLGAKYNINPNWAIDLEVRGQISPSILGAYSSGIAEGYFNVNLGVSYTIGGKKFVEVGKASADEMRAINDQVNKYKEELVLTQEALKQAQTNVQTKTEVRVETQEVLVAGPRSIFFKIGTSTVDDYGMVNIKQAAQIMKQNPDKKYKIAGYADKATSNSKYNQVLSEKRAQAVYEALVSEGVNKDQLEVVGFGGTDNMFGKDSLNRVVIIE